MRLKLHIAPILVAVFVMSGLLLAPAPAFAHAGHQHAQIQQKQPEAQAPLVHRTVTPAVAIDTEVTAAKTLPSTPSGDVCHDGFGCCSSGPCTGCHGAVLVSSAVPIPSFLSETLAAGDGPSRARPHDGRLRRPPKSSA